MHSRDILARLAAEGWRKVHQAGSHQKWKRTVVPWRCRTRARTFPWAPCATSSDRPAGTGRRN